MDFTSEPLKSSGLFAITGPTGSGKTTLLDVICLSLFNRVPRLSGSISRRVIQETGSILTRNTKEAFAEVDYECSKGYFRSRWSISTARTGKLRDYEMEVTDLQQGKLLDVKRSDVPNANAEQIGLSYDQFVKSILLAQGEFAKFLKANKSDRSALLEKITGTSIYRALGVKAFEMNKLHNAELSSVRDRQQVFKDQLLDNEMHQEQKELQKSLGEEKEQKEAIVKQLEKQLEQRSVLRKVRLEVQQLLEKEVSLRQSIEAFETQEGKLLKAHNSLSSEAEDLLTWKNGQQQRLKIGQEQEVLQSRISGNQKTLEQSLKKGSELVGRSLADETLLAELSGFQQEIEGLIEQKAQTQAAYRESYAQTLHLKKWGITIDPKHFEESLTSYWEHLKESATQIESLQVRLGEKAIEAPQEAIDRCAEQINLAVQAASVESAIKEQEQRIQKLEAEKEALKAGLQPLPEAIESAKTQLELQDQNRQLLGLKLENQKLRASLESHRAHLEAGEPCPLCGALEHPYAESKPEVEDQLERQLVAAEKEVKSLERQLLTYQQELSNKERELLQKTSAEKEEQGRLEVLQKQLQEPIKAFTQEQLQLSWQELQEQLRSEKSILESLVKTMEKHQELHQAQGTMNALMDLFQKGREQSAMIQQRYAGSDVSSDVRRIREDWIASKKEQENLVDQQVKLQSGSKELEQQQERLQTELIPLLQAKGFRDITSALSARLSEIRFQHLQNRERELRESQQLLQQRLNDQKTALKEQEEVLKGADLEALDHVLSEEKEQQQVLVQRWQEVNRQLRNHQENEQQVAALQKQIAEKELSGKKWELLNQYIGSSDGKKFNDFAQDLTLSQLVQLANGRLARLNDRYILDRSRKGEDDSLMVVDVHMGNERRSVKTLSGGETFLLSLSLALALSDLASRNVEINSLFIDEGFGTLDPEVLDQTLDTLERLQSEGSKTIGIISHVEALKERIATKVQLIRNGQGYSSLKVTME